MDFVPFTAFGCSNAKKTINLWLSCGLAIGGLSLESLEHSSHNLCYIFGCGFRLWQRCNERFSLMVAQVSNAPIGNAKTFFSLSDSLLMFFKEIAKSVMAWHRIKCLMVLLQDYLDDEHFLVQWFIGEIAFFQCYGFGYGIGKCRDSVESKAVMLFGKAVNLWLWQTIGRFAMLFLWLRLPIYWQIDL